MFETLQFGFGNTFITWVKMLYLCPSSFILTDGDRSGPFDLKRGVGPGDPLSPLLFDIALEPLATGIRNHRNIKGINVGNLETRASFYADDTLIHFTDPEVSIPPLLDFVNSFGKLYGYTINWGKSELMPLSDSIDPDFLKALPFKIAHDYVTYLGFKIPHNPKLLFKLNYTDILTKLKLNIENSKQEKEF